MASARDPRATFFDLLDPMHLSARLEQHLRSWRARATTAHLAIALDREPSWDAAEYLRVAGELDEIEQAFDPIKYREIPERPVLDVAVHRGGDFAPDGHAVLGALVSFVPESPQGGWTSELRDRLVDRVVDRLVELDPKLRDAIVKTQLQTPDELGNLHHGEHGLDQILVRPTPECSTRTRTSSLPIFSIAWIIASAEPCTSAFTTIGSSATFSSSLALASS